MHTLAVIGLGILIVFLFALSSWLRAGGLKSKGKGRGPLYLLIGKIKGRPDETLHSEDG